MDAFDTRCSSVIDIDRTNYAYTILIGPVWLMPQAIRCNRPKSTVCACVCIRINVVWNYSGLSLAFPRWTHTRSEKKNAIKTLVQRMQREVVVHGWKGAHLINMQNYYRLVFAVAVITVRKSFGRTILMGLIRNVICCFYFDRYFAYRVVRHWNEPRKIQQQKYITKDSFQMKNKIN